MHNNQRAARVVSHGSKLVIFDWRSGRLFFHRALDVISSSDQDSAPKEVPDSKPRQYQHAGLASLLSSLLWHAEDIDGDDEDGGAHCKDPQGVSSPSLHSACMGRQQLVLHYHDQRHDAASHSRDEAPSISPVAAPHRLVTAVLHDASSGSYDPAGAPTSSVVCRSGDRAEHQLMQLAAGVAAVYDQLVNTAYQSTALASSKVDSASTRVAVTAAAPVLDKLQRRALNHTVDQLYVSMHHHDPVHRTQQHDKLEPAFQPTCSDSCGDTAAVACGHAVDGRLQAQSYHCDTGPVTDSNDHNEGMQVPEAPSSASTSTRAAVIAACGAALPLFIASKHSDLHQDDGGGCMSPPANTVPRADIKPLVLRAGGAVLDSSASNHAPAAGSAELVVSPRDPLLEWTSAEPAAVTVATVRTANTSGLERLPGTPYAAFAVDGEAIGMRQHVETGHRKRWWGSIANLWRACSCTRVS